jgi:hypothetical protein
MENKKEVKRFSKIMSRYIHSFEWDEVLDDAMTEIETATAKMTESKADQLCIANLR